MKLILSICLLFLLNGIGFAQYGNEWIDYNNSYYKIKIVENGIYRLDYSTLQNAGVPVSTIALSDIKMYGKEKPVSVEVVDADLSTDFSTGDYLLFYAERNDGWLDSLVYDDPTNIGNPGYSLVNDTLVYYFTWDNTPSRHIVSYSNTNFGSFTPIPYIINKQITYNNTEYFQGELLVGNSSSRYIAGEGWFAPRKNAYSSNGHYNINIQTYNPYLGAGAPDANWHIITASTNNALDTSNTFNHHLQIQLLDGGTTTVLEDTLYNGYQVIKSYGTLAPTDLSSPSTSLRADLIGDLFVSVDYQTYSYTSYDYAQTLDLNNLPYDEFYVPHNSSETHSLLNLVNFNGSTPHVFVFGDTVRHIIPTNTGTWDVLIPNIPSGSEQKVVILDESEIKTVASVEASGNNGVFTSYLGSALDSAYVIITHPSLMGAANQYANFRASSSGGNFNVLTVNVEELYDQYGGGVEKHPLSIKRFMQDLYQNAPTPPKYLFLVGKGIREASDADHGIRKSSVNFHNCLVPTYGYPATDNHFVTDLDTSSYYVPNVAIGRLAAPDSVGVIDYLNKMIEHEANLNDPYTIPNKDWMKQVLHFSGGATTAEQSLFQSYLNQYANIIEDTCFGGHTNLHAKTSSQPIDLVEFQEIQDELEKGASIITFFGHASPTGFDQNIDDPQNWNNQGRYPFLIGNSCYTGDIHHPLNQSTSESFVLVPDRGTIGFLASTKLGFSGQLHAYCTELYTQIGQTNYGNSIGSSQMNSAKLVYDQYGPNNPYFAMTVSQLNLHGDPALRINPHPEPEFVITEPGVYIEPSTIDLSVDSITVNVILNNIGKATNDTFGIDVIRHFADGTDTTYSVSWNSLYYKDTLSLQMPLLPNKSTGINSFEILVDQPSIVDEAEIEISNNIITKNLTVEFDGILPIYPYDYAIIPGDSVVLKGSTINPLAGLKNYIFEIDTIDFEGSPSPFKRYQTVSSIGGVVEAPRENWLLSSTNAQDTLVLTDSTVYFWRVALDSSTLVWQERSFQYIEGRTGWGQAHYFQYKNDQYSSVAYDRPNREFDFAQTFRILDASVYGNANSAFEYANTLYSLDGSVDDGESNLCSVSPTIYVAVIDPFQLKAWENDGGLGTNHNYNDYKDLTNGGCRPWRTEGYFIFRQNSYVQLAALDTFITTHVPPGHFVLAYTVRAKYNQWNSIYPDLFTSLANKGATNMAPGNTEVPWLLCWQQGNPGSFQEMYGAHLNDTLFYQDTLHASNYAGIVNTPLAGPAYNWHSIHWEQEGLEVGNDSTRLRLIGYDLLGGNSQVMDTVFTAQDSIINLGSIVNASQYPYLQLQAFVHDSLSFTPAQLRRWQLVYDPVPELALNPKKGFYYSATNDTIQEGEDVSVAMAIENVSPFNMDSVLVHYYLEDNYFNKSYVNYPRQAPLLSNEFILDTVTFNTEDYPGKNSIWIEANPYINGIQDQLEQYYFNNLARITFEASEDKINPILDVTFDGIHILDGDIISGKPMIVISLDDENEFLIMNEDADTSNFVVRLTDPLGNVTRIPFVDGQTGLEIMRWFPATGPDNYFKIEYDAEFTVDGVYTLHIEATDISGNKSGDVDYNISFEVINASTITEVLNYPNPFSTRTQFVFTLTGNRLPDDMMIQIMTVTGKVVKEIQMAELGTLNIGRNRTEYWWDGTDQFGDPLANGVYLYKVFTRLDDEEIELRETSASEYFKKGFGKMYLMR